MLSKEIPFLRLGLPLCAGIVAGLYFIPDKIFVVLASLLIISGFFISLFFNKYLSNYVYGFALSSALFLAGLMLYTGEKELISDLENKPSQFICILSDFVVEREKSSRLEVELINMVTSEGMIPVHGSMIMYNEKDSSLFSFLPGDMLLIKCTPQEILNRGNPHEFDYKFYMQNQGIRYYAFTRTENIIHAGESINIRLIHRALKIRKKIIDMYERRGITGDTLAIVAAITLGQKNMLDPDQKQYFMKAGVLHIMAVSGLHAVILSYFIFKLLFFVRGRFYIFRIIATLLLLWSFAFVTGLTPSVLRATLMFSFIQAGMLMKRPVDSINSVLASAFILILIRPSVIFDAGFQLSYSAVIFIISFYRNLYSKVQLNNRFADKVWQSIAISVIAQAGTLSLTIMLFNRFPVWFIISNIIIIPLSSLVIILGCLVQLLFPVVFLSKALATILSMITGLTETLTQKIAELPLSTIEHIGLTRLESIILMVTIWLLFKYLLDRESLPAKIPLAGIFLFLITGTTISVLQSSSRELIVYNTIRSSTVGVRSGNVLSIYSDSSGIPEVLKHSDTHGLEIRMAGNNTIPGIIKTAGKNILICNELNFSTIQKTSPQIIILVGLYPAIEDNLYSIYPAKEIIISSEVSSSFTFPANLITHEIDTVHFVKNTGAYITRL